MGTFCTNIGWNEVRYCRVIRSMTTYDLKMELRFFTEKKIVHRAAPHWNSQAGASPQRGGHLLDEEDTRAACRKSGRLQRRIFLHYNIFKYITYFLQNLTWIKPQPQCEVQRFSFHVNFWFSFQSATKLTRTRMWIPMSGTIFSKQYIRALVLRSTLIFKILLKFHQQHESQEKKRFFGGGSIIRPQRKLVDLGSQLYTNRLASV